MVAVHEFVLDRSIWCRIVIPVDDVFAVINLRAVIVVGIGYGFVRLVLIFFDVFDRAQRGGVFVGDGLRRRPIRTP
jgi:hypothetical protein